MAKKSQAGIIDSIWGFFTSIKLTIMLLIILSIVCVIGTLIPQNSPTQDYLKLYSESTYNFFKAAGFLDLYHAWWFRLTMTLFTVNLCACSINRFPYIWRFISGSKKILDENLMQSLSGVKKFTMKNFSVDQQQKFEKIITDQFKRPTLIKKTGEWNFFAQKGRISRFGFYFTHLGLLIIIIGGVSGGLGFQGYMQIFEGETSNTVRIRDSNEVKTLDFSIRCDDFELTYYDKSMRPKDYKSALTVIEGGEEVFSKVIEVNDPLVYKGIFFYQSNYGSAPNKGEILLRVTVKDSGLHNDYRVKIGQSFRINNTEDEVRLDQFLPDFSIDSQGRAYTRSYQLRNPAAYLAVSLSGKASYNTWAFTKIANFHSKEEQPYDFYLLNFYPIQYTGLQVTRDPGVWVVWTGCLLMLFGTYVVFFTSHRRIWLRIEEKDGAVKTILAGSSNKNQVAFKSQFETLFKSLKS